MEGEAVEVGLLLHFLLGLVEGLDGAGGEGDEIVDSIWGFVVVEDSDHGSERGVDNGIEAGFIGQGLGMRGSGEKEDEEREGAAHAPFKNMPAARENSAH